MSSSTFVRNAACADCFAWFFSLTARELVKSAAKKHNQKRDGISLVIRLEGEFRLCKQKVKHQNTDDGGNQTVDAIGCGHRGDEHGQNVDSNDICLLETEMIEQKADQTCGN